MKKLLFILLILSACSKDKDPQEKNLVDITYEIQTTVTGFNEVKYLEYQSYSAGTVSKDWVVASTGTSTKAVKIPKGTLAQISAMHPTSNSWKIIIRSSTGAILSESTSINYVAGPPSYYSKTIDAAAQ